jgi:RHS repeat-associated protein
LGSTRALTKSGVMARKDYLPFGEEILVPQGSARAAVPGYSGSDFPMRHRFTGKERDAETGLDYFGARYMSSAQGRFTSPDKPFADQHPENPQSWNLYAYVRNNPLSMVDPNGTDALWIVTWAGRRGCPARGSSLPRAPARGVWRSPWACLVNRAARAILK